LRYTSLSWATIPRQPIVDTNLLFDFLLWRFSDSLQIPSLLSELSYLRTRHYKVSLQWYFRIALPVTTCPEVIAEIHGHAKRKCRGRLGQFWRFAKTELGELGLNEELIPVGVMDTDLLANLGPTDAALVHLSSLHKTEKRPILTEDSKLAGLCRSRELSAIMTMSDVLSMWQEHGSK
jgi:hypothetical protein